VYPEDLFERRSLIQSKGNNLNNNHRKITYALGAIAMATALGCASTPTKEGTGEYMDDSLITGKVKTAIFNEPTLKSAEINVETFKGVVQLSGFVASKGAETKAVEVARMVGGVKSVKDDMRLK
jgi:osmotically-inducible protein OsmY